MIRTLQKLATALLAVFLAGSAACYMGDSGLNGSGGSGGSGGGRDQLGGTMASTGLPCDVSNLLATRCQSCHGTTPTGGAPISLVTYHDLTAKSMSDPSQSVARVSIAYVQSRANPMPPAPDAMLTSAEVAVLQKWVSAGLPMGSCGSDGGAGATGTDGGDPYNTPLVCTSNMHWTGGDRKSSLMHPGRDCIACHKTNAGPDFVIAGTVFPTAHEPDDCDGTGSIQIVITDANGKAMTLQSNSAGNFYYQGSLAKPFHAKVVSGGKERTMSAAQTTGACNSCHTQTGANQAPGRIMAP